MFQNVLIANRGEIAVRIMRTARRLGLRTIAVYSEADAGALHVREADTAVPIGPADARRSYLDIDRILAAARETGAEAIHPGYGFLSENAAFADACAAAGVTFVGPPPAAIRAMGSKAQAKAIMERAGVPVVPGYHGDLQDREFLKRKAYEIGYPVLIKAVAGGGGKGMRRVDKALAFEEALDAAKREAAAAFGDDRVLVERFVPHPRHIEIQVFADGHGNAVSLHERDCSLQRRHQKVVEEAPAPGLPPEVRRAMGEAAVRAAEAVGYVGAGTVEFIAEGDALADGRFYFMEMNTRLQVEHPVTEAVTGFDLVEWQLRIAAGEPLPVEDVPPPQGHAVEVRLYAEDPDAGFLPSAGRLAALSFPSNVRVDSGVETGDAVSAFYDPMIAKLIVHGRDRASAFALMRDALDATIAIGPRTNLAFLRALVTHPDVLDGRHDTGLIDRELAALTGGTVGAQAIADAAASLVPPLPGPDRDPWSIADAFRMSGEASQSLALVVDGAERTARLVTGRDGARLEVDGLVGAPWSAHVVAVDGAAYAVESGRAVKVELVDQLARVAEAEVTGGAAVAPMHGRIVAVFVTAGDVVARDQPLFAIEAMKMEHTVRAPAAARVEAVRHGAGDQVAQGADVIALSPVSDAGDAGAPRAAADPSRPATPPAVASAAAPSAPPADTPPPPSAPDTPAATADEPVTPAHEGLHDTGGEVPQG